MNARHRKTLAAIFATPTRANITWNEVEAMLRGLGAEIDDTAAGSRVGVALNGVRMVLHKPHPGKEIRHYQVRALRDFLTEGGVTP